MDKRLLGPSRHDPFQFNSYPGFEVALSVATATPLTFDKKPMQKEGLQKQALKAWAKASAICVVASPAIFWVSSLFEPPDPDPIGSASAQFGLSLAVAGIAALVHFLAFLLIGLPLFLRFYSRPLSALWRWFPGILTGTLIGFVTVPLVLSVLYSRPVTDNMLQSSLAGGVYGGITALACLLNRPRVEQDGGGQPATRIVST